MRLTLVLLATLVLSACASLPQSDCTKGDWQTIGYHDGLMGFKAERIYEHAKACEAFGTVPDAATYSAGYERGIESFCRPLSAQRFGEQIRSYRESCPPRYEAVFMEHYLVGLNTALGSEITQEQNLQNELRNIRNARKLRYWLRKLTGRYDDIKEDTKYRISRSQDKQAEIKKLIEKWQTKDDQSKT